MGATRVKISGAKLGTAEAADPGTCFLLSLPEQLMQLVLSMLKWDTALALLHSSKAMAQQVMQHSSGKLELQVQARPGRNWAATKHLLQWAPPACMKLNVSSPYPPGDYFGDDHPELHQISTEAVNSLFGTLQASCTVRAQYTCLTTVHLQGLFLSWLVPPGLPDTCPKVHTLKLSRCRIFFKGSSSSSSSSEHEAIPVAPNINYFSLHETDLVWLDASGGASEDIARYQWPFWIQGQLKASLPNVVCLGIGKYISCGPALISVWGSKLTELLTHWHTGSDLLKHSGNSMIMQLQRLHKFVLTGFTATSPEHLKSLLKLPQLTHVEFDSVSRLTEDLSNHPCPWRYLRLHCRRSELDLEALGNVPLHSLTSPLALGYRDGDTPTSLRVLLPYQALDQVSTKLQQAADGVAHCGVQLLATEVVYAPDTGNKDSMGYTTDAQCAAQLSVVAPIFGAADKVMFEGWVAVGQQMIRALGAAHQHRLKQLTLNNWGALANRSETSWRTLLTCLPALERLALHSIKYGMDAAVAGVASMACTQLMLAMSEQPAGRHLELQFSGHNTIDLQRVLSRNACMVEGTDRVHCAITYPIHASNVNMVVSFTRTLAP